MINYGDYPLVMTRITMQNHHLQWKNPLFLWPFSIVMLNYQRVFCRWYMDVMVEKSNVPYVGLNPKAIKSQRNWKNCKVDVILPNYHFRWSKNCDLGDQHVWSYMIHMVIATKNNHPFFAVINYGFDGGVHGKLIYCCWPTTVIAKKF